METPENLATVPGDAPKKTNHKVIKGTKNHKRMFVILRFWCLCGMKYNSLKEELANASLQRLPALTVNLAVFHHEADFLHN